MEVNLINAQKDVERILKNIERDNFKLAAAELNTLKKNAYNKQYYLQQKLDKEQPSGIDYQILKAQHKQAQKEYAAITDYVNTIKTYMKTPERYDYKKNRADYLSVQRAFQRLNAAQAEKQAEKELIRAEQKRAGTVEGVTILNIRKSEKINALLQNVIYNNSNFDFSESELNRIAARIYELTGYDLNANIIDIFDTPQHYDSEGGSGNIPIFDSLVDISADLMNSRSGINQTTGKPFTPEELKELEEYINTFNRMYNRG